MTGSHSKFGQQVVSVAEHQIVQAGLSPRYTVGVTGTFSSQGTNGRVQPQLINSSLSDSKACLLVLVFYSYLLRSESYSGDL